MASIRFRLEIVVLQLLLAPRNAHGAALVEPRPFCLSSLLLEVAGLADFHRVFIILCVVLRLLDHDIVHSSVHYILLDIEVVGQTLAFAGRYRNNV